MLKCFQDSYKILPNEYHLRVFKQLICASNVDLFRGDNDVGFCCDPINTSAALVTRHPVFSQRSLRANMRETVDPGKFTVANEQGETGMTDDKCDTVAEVEAGD